MTLAATRRYALALSAVLGVVAGIIAATLIAVVFASPERVAVVMNESDLSSLVYLILDRLGAMASALWRVVM